MRVHDITRIPIMYSPTPSRHPVKCAKCGSEGENTVAFFLGGYK